MKNYSHIIKSLVVVYLVVMLTPAGVLAADLTQPSMEDELRNMLDTPVDQEELIDNLEEMTDGEFTELDPLTSHIFECCPDLTTGELTAINTMFSKQLNTPDGQDKFQFYINYLDNSSEVLVEGMTAHELYQRSPYYQSVYEHFEQIIKDYGHMSSDAKLEFLLTETPSLENTMKIIDNADNHKKHYIFEQTNPQVNKVQTLADELSSLSTDYIVSHANEVKNDTEELEKAQEDYYHAVSLADKKYDLYEEKPEKKETPSITSNYSADAYQNVKKTNRALSEPGTISNMNYANKYPHSIKEGDLLQLRVTNSSVSEKFPMFKYMVVRGMDNKYYYCEDLSLKPVDIKGNEIKIEEGKNGTGDPYKIKLEPNNNRKMVSKVFVDKTHDQYAILLNKAPYRPEYVGDLFDAVPVGIEELNDRISQLTPATPQHIIDSYNAQTKAGHALWGTGTALGAVGTVVMIVGGIAACFNGVAGGVVIGTGVALIGIGVGMCASGGCMYDNTIDALENAERNDNKRKNELKDLFVDIELYNEKKYYM